MPAHEGERAGIALVVGIGDYQDAERISSLSFAAADAKAVADVLADPDVCRFPRENVLLLTDTQARRDEVVRRLSKWLPERAAGAEIAVIYFAGHGLVQAVGSQEEGYLLPCDADPDDLATRGVAMSDVARWIDGVRARAVVVCLDCCHAGKIVARPGVSLRAAPRDLGIRPALFQQIGGQGRFLIASCDEGQQSVEAEELQHGLFTYHLLRGLAGEGDRDGDGKVGVAELFEHVAESVERDAREKFHRAQKPWSHSTSSGGVYLAEPRRGARSQSTGRHSVTPVPQEAGPTAAVAEIERQMRDAGEDRLIALLRRLRQTNDPACVPAVFRCLAHPSEAVRSQASKAVHALGWDRVTAAIEALARGGDADGVGAVLEGLAAFEAHSAVVDVLDRLVNLLRDDPRNRTILLLERKRLGLGLEKTAELFREINSPYRPHKVLGQGLFTAAYLALHQETGLEVVVRVLRPEFVQLPQVRARFLDLSRRSMRFVHQNLVLTRDVRAFADRHVYCTVRDYIPGATLQKVLEAGRRFEPLQVVKILRQVASALEPLHRDALPHGAVKPSNIFVCEGDLVLLGEPSLPLPGIGVALDRLAYDYRYAAPELFRKGGALGPASDFYGLGCVAYELACGQPPFVSDNHFELASRHDRDAVPPPARRGSLLGPAGNAFLMRLLDKSPERRPGRVEEVQQALDDLQAALRRGERPPDGPGGPPDSGPKEPAPPAGGPPSGPLLHDDSLARYAAAPSLLPFDQSPLATVNTGADLAAAGHTGPSQAGADPKRPESVGGYEILDELGRGGMGVVYKARQKALNRIVALKMVRSHSYAAPKEVRFRAEAEAVARLQHPNIVAIYDFGEHDGLPFFSMEYVGGGTLAQKLGGGPVAPDEAARTVETLARAVHAAHQHGIIHRDIKPANVLLTSDGVPKVSDFGLAKHVEGGESLTNSGDIVGTPNYMAPEQAEGRARDVGPEVDVHGLGGVLYALLTGQPPFRGATLLDTLEQVRSQEPVPPSRLQPVVPRDLETICLKCLRKDPRARYASAEALADDLRRFLSGARVEARPPGLFERARRLLWGKPSGQTKQGP